MRPRRAYLAWKNMMYRCTDPTHRAYKDYGGRGITVCDRWQLFIHFLEDMGYPPPKLTLERIDNNLGYFPENCRWATREEQNKNRSKKFRKYLTPSRYDADITNFTIT